jgi:hypothetical protein
MPGERAAHCRKADSPEPDGGRAAGEGEIDARERVHGARAAAVPPPDTAQLDGVAGVAGTADVTGVMEGPGAGRSYSPGATSPDS